MLIKKSQTVKMKDISDINEAMIQDFIFKNPDVLGLGSGLVPVAREKVIPGGGRIDLVFKDDKLNCRYEVEIMLGDTDESHIIRTIEYWDMERRRYPGVDHCAVIVAEGITRRFFNVISLFNGAIPLYALKMTAIKDGDDIQLVITRVLERMTYEGEEEEKNTSLTTEQDWISKSTPQIMKSVTNLFQTILADTELSVYKPRYTQQYIGLGLGDGGPARNFVTVVPQKKGFSLTVRDIDVTKYETELDDTNLIIQYKTDQITIRLKRIDEFTANSALLLRIIKDAKNNREGN